MLNNSRFTNKYRLDDLLGKSITCEVINQEEDCLRFYAGQSSDKLLVLSGHLGTLKNKAKEVLVFQNQSTLGCSAYQSKVVKISY